MLNKHRMFVAGAALLAMLQGAGLARAAAGAQPEQSPNSVDGTALNDQLLDAYRGGAEVLNDMNLKGVVSDNQAYNVSTGNNTVTNGALAGSSGLPMLIQNSGNNVLIQNATIVNVQMQP